MCGYFIACIYGCYIVGDGSPVPNICLYRYTRQKKLWLLVCADVSLPAYMGIATVGEGSPLPSSRFYRYKIRQIPPPPRRLYRYTRQDLSSFSLPLRGRGTATRWKEFIAMRSFRHFLAKMTPRPLLGDACKGASHTCKSPPSRRRPARQQRAKLIEYFIDLKEILCYHISYRNGYFMN